MSTTISTTTHNHKITHHEQSLDVAVDNKLKGLIDDEELLKGSEEISKLQKITFFVDGCSHDIYFPKDTNLQCKLFYLQKI